MEYESNSFSKLTVTQEKAINNFKPPKIYCWFFKHWSKWLVKVSWLMIIIGLIVGALQEYFAPTIIWTILISIFIMSGGIGVFAFIVYLIKHFYTKKYAKSIGLSLQAWNYWAQGITF